ncbi:MAG: alanine--tRNA ligase [Minisyncoccales bacterium]
MTTKEIREKYLKYFNQKGHAIIPSCSLVPDNDPTTLFTSAGMQQMIPYLLGQTHPLGTRIANAQKCLRTQDIEEVGDNRHMTFFEMLGNWSLNDYFKKEQLSWMFEFLTKEVGLEPKNIYVTAFRGLAEAGIPRDEETANVWKELFKSAGIDAKDVAGGEHEIREGEKIFYYDEKKNWWSRSGVPQAMPEGELGGPDSEMFWDFGADLKLHENSPWRDLPCHPNCDCGRFLEIGNNVFMEYVKRAGAVVKMENHNVDFGGGLERIAAAANSDPDVFNIGLFKPVIEKLELLSGKKYKDGAKTTAAMRVIADHIRGAVFLIADGVLPSNKAQGYFARRLVRRAIVKGHELGIENNFLNEIASIYLNIYQLAAEQIRNELEKEETKFRKTLKQGLKEMERRIAENTLDGKQLFDLYQSYGFPLELSLEIAKEKNVSIAKSSINNFNAEFKKHQELSRTAGAGMFKGGLADAGEQTTKLHTAAHLLLAALRQVLGGHVVQRGSNITAERLRFDFSHPEKITPEEIRQVEYLVNEQIKKNIPVDRKEMALEDARASGAMGVFGSKYGEKVAVYAIGGFSKEICGGPHAENTGELGRFKIVKEESSSSGVRRIKAILE